MTCSVAGSMTDRVDQRLRPSPARPRPAPRSRWRLGPPRGARARRGRSRWPGCSIASITSSSAQRPVTPRPSPSSPTPWWWCDLTADALGAGGAARPASRARAARRGRRTRPAPARWRSEPSTVGQVLVERAAEGDVQHLHAAADAEDGHVALERRARQRDLEPVALGSRAVGLRVGLGAVGGRVDVGAAGQHQARRSGRAVAPGRRPRRRGAAGTREPAGVLDRVRSTLRVRSVTGSSQTAQRSALDRGADPDRPAAHQSRSKPR